jgi:hypothetical protein
MNQRYRNESHGGYHGDELRDRSMRGDDRYSREPASSRDWDQRDLGTRGGEYSSFGSYGDRGFGQGAGGRDFRESEYGGESAASFTSRPYGESGARYGSQRYGGEEYGWSGQSYARDREYSGSPGGDNRFSAEGYGGPGGYQPEGAVNQRNFGGGQAHGSTAGYGGGYGGGEGYRQSGYGGQAMSRQSFGAGGERSRSQGFGGQNYWGQGGTGGTDFGSGQGFGGQGYAGQGGQYGQYGQGSQFGQNRNTGYSDMSSSGYGSGMSGGYGQGMRGYGMQGGGTERGDSTRGFRGLGPKGYRRSDERLQEDICERLTDDPMIDASDVTVQVAGGVVTLEGSVSDRRLKHRIEDMVEQCGGVGEIRNNLSVKSRDRFGGSDDTLGGRQKDGSTGQTQAKGTNKH